MLLKLSNVSGIMLNKEELSGLVVFLTSEKMKMHLMFYSDTVFAVGLGTVFLNRLTSLMFYMPQDDHVLMILIMCLSNDSFIHNQTEIFSNYK